MNGRNVVLVTIVRSGVSLSVFQVRLEADVCKVDFYFLPPALAAVRGL